MHAADSFGSPIAVINDDDFMRGMALRQNAGNRLLQKVMPAARGNDDGDLAHVRITEVAVQEIARGTIG